MWQTTLSFQILQQRKQQQNKRHKHINVWLYYKMENRGFGKHDCWVWSAWSKLLQVHSRWEVKVCWPFLVRAGLSRGPVRLQSRFLWFHCPNWCGTSLLLVEMCGYLSDFKCLPRELNHPTSPPPWPAVTKQAGCSCWASLVSAPVKKVEVVAVAVAGPIRLFGGCTQAASSVSPVPAECPVWRWPESESSPSPPERAAHDSQSSQHHWHISHPGSPVLLNQTKPVTCYR